MSVYLESHLYHYVAVLGDCPTWQQSVRVKLRLLPFGNYLSQITFSDHLTMTFNFRTVILSDQSLIVDVIAHLLLNSKPLIQVSPK